MKQPVDPNSEQERNFLAFSVATKLVGETFNIIQQVCPHINIGYFTKIALKLLDYEIITETKDNKNYQTSFELLKREIFSMRNEAGSWTGASCSSPLSILSSKACIIYNITFRFIAIFLDHLERDVREENLKKINHSIIETMEDRTCPCPMICYQPYPLNSIFQHCRRSKLTQSEFCFVGAMHKDQLKKTKQLTLEERLSFQTAEMQLPRSLPGQKITKTRGHPLQQRKSEEARKIPETTELPLQKRSRPAPKIAGAAELPTQKKFKKFTNPAQTSADQGIVSDESIENESVLFGLPEPSDEVYETAGKSEGRDEAYDQEGNGSETPGKTEESSLLEAHDTPRAQHEYLEYLEDTQGVTAAPVKEVSEGVQEQSVIFDDPPLPSTEKLPSEQNPATFDQGRSMANPVTGFGTQVSMGGHQGQASMMHPGQVSMRHLGQTSMRLPGQVSMRHLGQTSMRHPGQVSMGHLGQTSMRHSGQVSMGHPGQVSMGQPPGASIHPEGQSLPSSTNYDPSRYRTQRRLQAGTLTGTFSMQFALGSGYLKAGDRSTIVSKNGKAISLTQAARNNFYNPYLPKKAKSSWQQYLIGRVIVNHVLLPPGFNLNLPPGSCIKIKQLLGKGGNGEVYLVDYGVLPDFRYVLKVPMPPVDANTPLFMEEIAKLKRIREIDNVHLPKIISSEFRCENYSVPFYLMHELQPIERLLGAPKNEPLYPPSCAMFFYGLLRALKDLSFHHIIHCDIKPDNILFFREIPVLLDFGASRTYDEINELEIGKKAGLLHGTPTYLPPEILEIEDRLDGQHLMFCMDKVTQKIDIWALGLVLMKWLTGKSLFEGIPLGNNLLQILENIRKHFQKDRLNQYRHECERILGRLYLASDPITQKRMRETDVKKFYASAALSAKSPMAQHLRSVDFKGSFIMDILKIFDLCTNPYDDRPKASQLMTEVENFFPWIKEKYDEILRDLFIPPLDETYLTTETSQSIKDSRVLKKLDQFFPPRK